MSGNGQFQTVNGQIIDPNGNVFRAQGINVYDSQMGNASQILADFPGLNFVRLNVYSYQSPSAYASFIQTMSAAGVVVELEDHTNSTGSNAGGGSGSAFTGQQLTNESNWYASVASAYKSNPYVWFGTNNEPPAGGLSAWEQATYNAIRGTGNTSTIMMEVPGGGYPGSSISSQGMDPSVYTSMTNIVADAHFYGWDSSYSTNQSTVNASLASLVQGSQTMISASGAVPVIIGEYGPSTNGSSTDANGSQVLTAVQQASETSGGVAWGWDSGQNDNLTDGSGNLTSFGQEVAGSFTVNPAQKPPVTTPPVTTPPGAPAGNPSANDTVVMAGSTKSLVDAAGNVWTITSGGQVGVNGTADTTTSGVTELAIVNGTIWQENASGLWYGKTSPTAGWTAGTATSPLPAPTPPVTTPPVTPPPVTVIPSANDTIVLAGSTAAITDAAGNKWTITSGAQVAVNGTADATTANVTELAIVNGTIWQENASGLWWGETSPAAGWTGGTATSPLPATPPVTTPPVITPPVITPPATVTSSPNDTVVMARTTAAITDASGNQWTITAGNRVAMNGTADLTTANVTELAYVKGAVWQENGSGQWFDKTSSTAAWSSGTATSPLPPTTTIAQSQTSATISASGIEVVATAGAHMVFISGSNDIVSLSGGKDSITDTGSNNGYVLAAAGKGYDTFTNNILTGGDTLDLRTALAATTWNGAASTLSNYLTVTDSAKGAVLSIASGSSTVGLAMIDGATTANLTGLLAHSIT